MQGTHVPHIIYVSRTKKSARNTFQAQRTMNFKTATTILLSTLFVLLSSFSCDGTDSVSSGAFHRTSSESLVEMATVTTTEQATALRLDSHVDTPVRPDSYQLLNLNSLTQDGRRLLLEYEWADAQAITLQHVRAATTKDIARPSGTTLPDSLGHEPVYVQKAWIAGGYLNVIYRIYYTDAAQPHTLSAATLGETDSSGRPVLTLCHNAGKDLGATLSYPAYLCIRLDGQFASASAISLRYRWGDTKEERTLIATANPSLVELSNDCVFF